MQKNILYFIIGILLIGTGCQEESMNIGVVDPSEYVVETIIPTGEERYLNTKSDYIFDQEKLHTFELNIPVSDFAKLNADPAAEEYVAGSLTFEGETISPVGVRYKGSIGAFAGCTSGGDWANPSGFKTCYKLSIKVKINWEDSDSKFYDLKKLQFHSQNHDASQMRERLGYWFFREMGVPAPRSVHARLMINGEYAGLFALTEQIDGRFTRHNFDNGKGNLYKEIWPLTDDGIPFPNAVYLNHLKTNEDENPTAEQMRTFAEEVANATSENEQAVIKKWMEVDEIMAYIAVDRAIRNDDGAFHWYCNTGGCNPHNFYWYEDPKEKTMHLIPWDLDNAFENIIINQNPITPIADEWGETRANCMPFAYGAFRIYQRSATCDKVTRAWASFKEEYAEKKNKLITGAMSEAAVEAKLMVWSTQIRAATLEAKEKHQEAISEATWERAMNKLREQLAHAREQ